MSGSLVDWRVADRVARRAGGAGEADARRLAAPLRPGPLTEICDEAQALLRAHSELDPPGALPQPEPVGREEWIGVALATLAGLAEELEREQALRIDLPGPLGRIARGALGVAAGAEIGVAAGYASRRVLGQYDVALLGVERPPRLLFVAPNLLGASRELGVDPEPFVRWIALHESAHALQFAAAPWLREHLGELIRRLVRGAAKDLGIGDMARRLAGDPRDALRAFLRGDLARALAGPEQLPVLDSIEATMTAVEGHAEHLMDAAAGEFVPDAARLRDRLEERRRSRGPLETIVTRVLGLDLKLRQYEHGKAFCDAVAERAGSSALNRLWAGPEGLPSLDELRDPDAWLTRVAAVPVTAQ